MNTKLRTLKHMRRVREQLRDVATARVTLAGIALEHANNRRDQAVATVEAHLDRPPVDAEAAVALLIYDDARLMLESNATAVRAERADELSKLDAARGVLRGREKELRSTERSIFQNERELQRREHRADQRMADDLSGRRPR